MDGQGTGVTLDIFEEIARIRRERTEAALATVVGGEKGTPGKMGFRMLVYPDGWISGTVGGGLVEAKVRDEALRCLRDKKPKLLEFTLDEESAEGIGVLCGGKVKIFVEPILGRRRAQRRHVNQNSTGSIPFSDRL